jgi:hypothetical protein
MKRPRIYGNEKRFKAAVARHIASGEELLEQAVGARNQIAALTDDQSRRAFYIHEWWGQQFRRWFGNAQRA